MKVKKLLWLTFIVSLCCGSEIPEYIGRLLKDLKIKEPSQVHDVVLINLGTRNIELTEKIAEVILKENVVQMPPPQTVVTNQRIRAASVLIIILANVNEVRLLFIFFDRIFSKYLEISSECARIPA